MTVGPAAVVLTDGAIEPAIAELRGIQDELRAAHRQSGTTMGLVVAAAAIVVSLPDGSLVATAMRILPVLVGIAAMYNLNTASDIAALAELRDCLASRINRALGAEVFCERMVADARRLSAATVGAYVLTIIVMAVALASGLYVAGTSTTERWGWLLLGAQVAVTGLIVVLLIVGIVGIRTARRDVVDALRARWPHDVPRGGEAQRARARRWWDGL